MSDNTFYNDFISGCDSQSSKYDTFMFIGDFNYDLQVQEKSSVLLDACDVFDLSNHVKKPTCFTSTAMPSLIDLILINQKSYIHKVLNFSTGLSDVHNCIATQLNCDVPLHKKTNHKM